MLLHGVAKRSNTDARCTNNKSLLLQRLFICLIEKAIIFSSFFISLKYYPPRDFYSV